ncbi:MAG TPA: transglutaminase-like domain-containing protein [Polyangiaceae bacterium]|nr:transglutaminase-like domain-containing protein [Polyangiaceae bacterium]
MRLKRQASHIATSFALLLPLSGAGLFSCAGQDEGSGADREPQHLQATKQRLGDTEAEAVTKTMAPIRSLQTPGNVYMTSIEQTVATTGTFQYIVYAYQPDATGEGIRFELTARTSGGAVDSTHTFQSVILTSRPGEPGESQLALASGSGQRVYSFGTSRQGWYRLSFTHGSPSAGRTLGIKAYDASGNSLKMAWSDPPGVNAQVRVGLAVTQASNVFLKGGAYRNTDPAQFAYADHVKVDGNLLYRRSFDQGRYNFPIGRLNAGQHTLEFSLNGSAGDPKYWYGVNEKSFDTLGSKSAWDPVQFLYYGSMHTGDYDAWSEGVALAQGSTVPGSRPPPVRRGTTFSVALTHPSLNTGNATIEIQSVFGRAKESWTRTLPADADYGGAIFVSGSPSARHREHWRITVPADAPVGRYILRAFTPGSAQLGNPIQFYVIHNPYTLLASGAISKAELETYGYDEDEDGVAMQGPHGSDRDALRDHFTTYYDGSAELGYTPKTMITGAFRRTKDESSASMLDIAAASMDTTTNEFESMLRLYRIVAQRIRYQNPAFAHDSSETMVGGTLGPDPSLAFWYSLPGTELEGLTGGQCYEYGTVLTALARSAGLLARPVSSAGAIAGWGNHIFAEAYIPSLPQHGGKRTSSPTSANSDTDPWYAFDATDPNSVRLFPRAFTTYSEAVAPRAKFGRAATLMQGPLSPGLDVVTNPTNWDPLSTAVVGPSGVASVTAAYASGPEFWLTASGVTGWVGYGEKDFYRISKTITGARAVRVTALPGGSSSPSLNLKLCVGSVTSVPVMSDRCADAATSYPLPAGESYVVVFNDGEDMPLRFMRGDVTKYVLDLEY